MSDDTTYRRNDRGSWVPNSNADSMAEEMTRSGTRFTCGVRQWTCWESDSYQRDTGDPGDFRPGERHITRLRLTLDTDRRNFHTISEAGVRKITGGLTLDVYTPTTDDEIGGQMRHWGPSRDEPERNDLLGTMIVGSSTMTRLLSALRADERVSIGLRVLMYKTGIARSFDEDWMIQDFYVETGTPMTIDWFSAEYSEDRKIEAPADSDAEVEARHAPAGATDKAIGRDSRVRLNWIVGLLAMLVLIELLRR